MVGVKGSLVQPAAPLAAGACAVALDRPGGKRARSFLPAHLREVENDFWVATLTLGNRFRLTMDLTALLQMHNDQNEHHIEADPLLAGVAIQKMKESTRNARRSTGTSNTWWVRRDFA